MDGRQRVRVGGADARRAQPDSLHRASRVRARPVYARTDYLSDGAFAVKYIDEYRDAEAVHRFARAIERITTREWAIMEICGGQTHAIVKYGVDELLPEKIQLLHGPGCPVCVTPVELIDKAVDIAARPDVIFTSCLLYTSDAADEEDS